MIRKIIITHVILAMILQPMYAAETQKVLSPVPAKAQTPTKTKTETKASEKKGFWIITGRKLAIGFAAIAAAALVVFGGSQLNERYLSEGPLPPYQGILPTNQRALEDALRMAAKKGDASKVQAILIKEPNTINAADEDGWTALMWASKNGKIRTVKLLLNNGANVQSQEQFKHFSPIILAADNGHDDVVQVLINKKANIETADEWGRTSLMLAASKGKYPMVQFLLRKKAIVNKQDSKGDSPLTWAVREAYSGPEDADNRYATVQLLLAHGAKKDVINNKGETALDLARANGYPEIEQLMMSTW